MTIKSLLGLAEVDDDGTAASAPAPAPAKPGAAVQKVIDKIGGKVVPTMDAMTLCGALREAKTLAELDTLAAQAKSLPESERGEAREIYAKRKEELS